MSDQGRSVSWGTAPTSSASWTRMQHSWAWRGDRAAQRPAPAGAKLALANDCVFLSLPVIRQRACFRVFIWRQSARTPAQDVLTAMDKAIVPSDLRQLCKGSAGLWPDVIQTAGRLGAGRSGYVVDTAP